MEKILQADEIAGDNRMLILGDFNLPHIDWEERDLRRGARTVEHDILDIINDCFLYQHMREDTRFMNVQSSLLDLIFTKEEGDIKNIEVEDPLEGSDHGIVTADFVSKWKSRLIQRPRRMYHKGDYIKINEDSPPHYVLKLLF